jgi:transcriptional antiterminator RfaH
MGRIVTYTQGVSRLIRFGDRVPEIPENFVKVLQEEVARVESKDEEIVVDWQVQEGDEVEVADGPFAGMEGQVVKVRPGSERVSLLLEFMGEAKPVEISLYSLILDRPEIPEGWKGI